MIQVPQRPGQLILDEVTVRIRPLLDRSTFVRFCDQRNLNVSAELLQQLEEMRVLAPIIRIYRPQDDTRILHLDGKSTTADFDAGWIEDCSAPDSDYPVPDIDDPERMSFYSEFQVWSLERVLRRTNQTLTMADFARPDSDAVDWNTRFRRLRSQAIEDIAELRSDTELAAVPILCQLISNRYLPHALGNQRSHPIGAGVYSGEWMVFGSTSWNWQEYCEEWAPVERVKEFDLDEQSLMRAHRRIASAMRQCDPLWRWRNLIQFVNQRHRDQLRGDARRAELYRQSAELLRRLHRDLYETDLGPPEDSLRGGPPRIPEPEVRENPREHLQFVVNQYDLNPQPKAVLFVEGESEVVFARAIFRDLFGMNHGVPGVEISNLHGVDNATGNKVRDRYNAIFRLVDYLLEQQTLVFLLLDREGHAEDVERDASTKRSIFGSRKRAISPERIHVWERNFELDNFDDEELARALTVAAGERIQFAVEEVHDVRLDRKRASLSALYQQRAGRSLKKPELAKALAELAVQFPEFSDGVERPIIDFLFRVSREAARNPLPASRDIWRQNQAFLDAEERGSGR